MSEKSAQNRNYQRSTQARSTTKEKREKKRFHVIEEEEDRPKTVRFLFAFLPCSLSLFSRRHSLLFFIFLPCFAVFGFQLFYIIVILFYIFSSVFSISLPLSPSCCPIVCLCVLTEKQFICCSWNIFYLSSCVTCTCIESERDTPNHTIVTIVLCGIDRAERYIWLNAFENIECIYG